MFKKSAFLIVVIALMVGYFFTGCGNKDEKPLVNTSENVMPGADKVITSESVMQKINAMTREEKESVVTFKETKDSPSGLKVIVAEIFLQTIPNFDRTKPVYAAGGEGNSLPNVSGNGWLNGMKADQLESWRFKDQGDGTWSLNLPEPVQFDCTQAEVDNEGYIILASVKYAMIEAFRDGGWKPSWSYFNHTGAKHRVAIDHKKFPVKG